MNGERNLYGLIGEFVRSQDIEAAARGLIAAGYRKLDAFSPTPIDALDEIIAPQPRIGLVLTMFVGGIAGALVSYFLQYYLAVVNYPINVGGRPLDSWPAFVPTAWEFCALFTVFAGFGAFFLVCRLPRLYHPIFNAPGFERATQDRFFLCVEATDPSFNPPRIAEILRQHGAVEIAEVPE
jgi:hypothetical protein